jgi:prepilin-type N-terminal cleavage/methylation domain-containing protein
MKKMKKGFTIVELVIVIGVIAILSAILIPTFVNLNKKAQDAKVKSDLASAYHMYAADAADGFFGEETSGVALELFGAEDVKLAQSSIAGSVAVYSYDATNGWSTSTSNVTIGEGTSNYYVVGGTASYLGYFVLHLNA